MLQLIDVEEQIDSCALPKQIAFLVKSIEFSKHENPRIRGREILCRVRLCGGPSLFGHCTEPGGFDLVMSTSS
ncbi:hypothetical protein D3C85_1700680 [compost metagenome]